MREVRQGELFGFIGPDGAGKTTLFRILTTLLLPDAGSARVLGARRRRGSLVAAPRHRIHAGPLLALPGPQRARRISTSSPRCSERRSQREYEQIAPIYSQLEPFNDRARRGAVRRDEAEAGALLRARSPAAILFLDEPTTGVDAVSRREFWELLARMFRAGGLTIRRLDAVHGRGDRCDRVALMQRGRVLAIDAPQRDRGVVRAAAVRGARGEPVSQRFSPCAPIATRASRLSLRRSAALRRRARRHRRRDAPRRTPPTLLHAAGHRRRSASSRPSRDDRGRVHGSRWARRKRAGARGAPHEARRMNRRDAIRAHDLTRTFGTFTAVDHITFDVRPGEVFGFLGANGAGKTTAIRMLTGLLAPSSGEAWVAGHDVYDARARQIKRDIGYMSQRFSLYDDLTVRENIRLYGGIYDLSRDQDRDRTESSIRSRLGRAHSARSRRWHYRSAGSRSSRSRSRCCTSRSVVFLDEPTSGVDPITRRQFWELIYEAAHAGTTVLVTTHYMDEAEYCDRISIMVSGRIAALGAPAELKQRRGRRRRSTSVFVRLARPSAESAGAAS